MASKSPLKILLTFLVFVVSFLLIATGTFFGVIFLAGPHGGALPEMFSGLVITVGWLLVIFGPIAVSWRFWIRG